MTKGLLIFLVIPLNLIAQIKSDTSIIGCGEFVVRQYDSIKGVGTETNYYDVGKISDYYTYHWPNYKNTLDSGKAFFRNGNLAISYYNFNGSKHGPFLTYYENGQLKTKGQSYNGFANGIWEEYYANGKLKAQRQFQLTKNDSVFDGTDSLHKKVRDKLFRDTTEYGRLSNTDTLLNSECKDIYITSIYAFIEPDRVGTWKFFNDQGVVTEKIKYARKRKK